MFFRNGSPAAWAAAAALAAALVLPAQGGTQEVEVGDVMNGMEKAYTEVVNALLLFPVRESGDEPPLAVLEKQLGEIARIAGTLPLIENYKNDNAFRNKSLTLEKESKRMAALVKTKNWPASIAALARLQAGCLGCHKDFRF